MNDSVFDHEQILAADDAATTAPPPPPAPKRRRRISVGTAVVASLPLQAWAASKGAPFSLCAASGNLRKMTPAGSFRGVGGGHFAGSSSQVTGSIAEAVAPVVGAGRLAGPTSSSTLRKAAGGGSADAAGGLGMVVGLLKQGASLFTTAGWKSKRWHYTEPRFVLLIDFFLILLIRFGLLRRVLALVYTLVAKAVVSGTQRVKRLFAGDDGSSAQDDDAGADAGFRVLRRWLSSVKTFLNRSDAETDAKTPAPPDSPPMKTAPTKGVTPSSGASGMEVGGAAEVGPPKEASPAPPPAAEPAPAPDKAATKTQERFSWSRLWSSLTTPNMAAKVLVGRTEAPLLSCLIISMVCHLAVWALKAVMASMSGATAKKLELFVSYTASCQLLNYMLHLFWLGNCVLDVTLLSSSSRPSIQGDLSNPAASAPAASQRYAQQAATTQVLKVLLTITCATVCLEILGFNVRQLLAVTSVGGVLASFFLGDILSNLIGCFVLYLTQPFAQGDWVQSADGKIDGWIRSIGWYYTTIISWEKRPHYIPNSTFAHRAMINCSRMSNRRIIFEGPVRLSDMHPGSRLEEILTDVRKLLDNHTEIDQKLHRICRLREINAFSSQIWISCYTTKISLMDFLTTQESIILGITAILRKYETSWASGLERYTMPQKGEMEPTAEYKRLNNARLMLMSRERDLKDRSAHLEELRKENEEQERVQDQLVKERQGQVIITDEKQKLVIAKKRCLNTRRHCLDAKISAKELRTMAVEKLRYSTSVFAEDPELARNEYQEALAKRQESVQAVWNAVGFETNATKRDMLALEQERALLEQRLSNEEASDDSEAEEVAEPAAVEDAPPVAVVVDGADSQGLGAPVPTLGVVVAANKAAASDASTAVAGGLAADATKPEEVLVDSETRTVLAERQEAAKQMGGE
eukprot:TRINITY_DN51057_c0_g1_i1.p1 TRINITY_DN51057_c0_g1~~TRINITY_DN51057_c0_g1_i1.p1  ORF type:complete len:919 (-),score=283.49 TRINITY_DN51057_c0_g1_i1:150-2906(-)